MGNSRQPILCPILILLFSVLVFAQEEKLNTKIWSIHYWHKMAELGLVKVASDIPVPEARYTGSNINARTVLIDDSPDVPVTTDPNTTQSENSIFVNPLDNNKALNSNNSTDFPVTLIFGTSGFFTTDGGQTWGGQKQGTGGNNSGDPAAAIDLTGRYYVGYIADNDGQGVAYSTDEGFNWTHVQVANASGFSGLLDKNHLWIDNSPASPHAGNLYSAWTDFGGPNNEDIALSRSTDGGLTWSTPVNISAAVASGSHDQGVNIQTGPNGEVYAAWSIYDSSPSDETAIGFAKSTDGGATFQPATRIITNIRGIRLSETSKNQRVASFPVMAVDISGGSRNGWIYLVWTNIGVPGINTGPDIDNYMVRSTDGGASWSTPVKVNQDPSGLGNEHYFPWITCDPVTGALSVVFYDDRNVGGAQCEVFVANSLDGGVTWEDFKVSDVSFTPAPIPGLAGGYMGDYLGISAHGGKVYPCWTDNRSGHALTYVSPFTLADPTDPNPPGNAAIYSDFTTPTSMQLSWSDPTNYTNGDTLLPSDFTIEIYRDDVPLISVNSGMEQYTDTGLNDGQLYTYTLYTKDVFDSLSLPVNLTWHAGGSPFPAAPANLACAGDTVQALLTWNDPVTQSDGTPLDDLDSIRVYRNGVHITSVAPGAETYTDTPSQGFVYRYTVTALDNEVPPNESALSNVTECFVGYTPNFLVWVGPDARGASAESGDSLFEALVANGESSFLTNDLYEFGNDLSIYEGVFVVLGIYSNNHVIDAADPEGPALEAAIQAGTHVYLEGGDCFNYDPEFGGYNIRPWFGLDLGEDGSEDVAGIIGLNDLSTFSFPYNGENNFMDELVPLNSTPVWQNNANSDISGVFYTGFGSGRSIGVVPSFGGLVDNSAPLYPTERIVEEVVRSKPGAESAKSRPVRTEPEEFVKRAAYYPELKKLRKDNRQLFKTTAAGVQVLANTKVDLMAAYLGLFRSTGAPQIAVSPGSFTDTLLVGATSTRTMTVTNIGGTLAAELIFSVTENPPVDWLNLSLTSDTLASNQSSMISLEFDATGLAIGNYSTTLEVASNDTGNPLIFVPVTLQTNGAPVVSFSPDSLLFNLEPGQVDSAALTIFNTGEGPLTFELSDQDIFNAQEVKNSPKGRKYPLSYYGQQLSKDEKDSRGGTAPIEGAGGPDNFGYRWIDSDEPAGPVFNWIDITGSGIPVVLGDDDFVEVTLPFSFSFYGTDYNMIKISSNGYLTFGVEGSEYLNDPIPTFTDPNNILCPFWDDLNPTLGGTIHYFASSTQFIVQYTDIQHYVPSGPGEYTFEAILNNNGSILFQYLDVQGTLNSTTIGIENADGTDGLEVVFNASYVHNNLAIRFAAESAWLSQNPVSGTVAAGDSASVQVIADATLLTEGTYRAKIIIASNDPLNPEMEVRVKLQVQSGPPLPAIAVSPDSMAFDTVFVNQNSSRDMYVINTGTAELSVSNILSTNNFFTVNTSNFVVQPGDSAMVTVTFAPLSIGLHTGWLRVVSNDPSMDTLDVHVEGVGEVEVGIGEEQALPKEFAVSPNYPNPFNPSTTIKYQLPRDAEVQLVVYNILGQVVRNLVNTRLEAGYYQAVWDGRNDAGLPVGSGIYIYKFRAGEHQNVRKMILMK